MSMLLQSYCKGQGGLYALSLFGMGWGLLALEWVHMPFAGLQLQSERLHKHTAVLASFKEFIPHRLC